MSHFSNQTSLLHQNASKLGLAQLEQGVGIVSFGAALVGAVVIFLVQLLLFFLLRNLKQLEPIYKPKTELPDNFKSIFLTIVRSTPSEIIETSGMDAYFFLRYLRTQLFTFLPICAIALPILIPLNYVAGNGWSVQSDESDESDAAAGPSSKVAGLDTLAWGNIRPVNTGRYTAHLIIAVMAVIWVCAISFFEFRQYVQIRLDYLTSPGYRSKVSANTIVVSSIPQKWLQNEEALRNLFEVFPGGVRKVWINRNLNNLLRKISSRDKIQTSLEENITKYIRAVNRAKMRETRGGSEESACNGSETKTATELHAKSDGGEISPQNSEIRAAELKKLHAVSNSATAEEIESWKKYRPKRGLWLHARGIKWIKWLPGIPFLCEENDAIRWYHDELAQLNDLIAQEEKNLIGGGQQHSDCYPRLNVAFIQFNRQVAAHMACQSVIHHIPRQMAPRLCEVSPGNIIWSNMGLSWWQELARTAFVVCVLMVMIVLWAIPVAWSAALSQLSNVLEDQAWLSFLRRNASVEYMAKALAGVLPAAILGLLMSIVPFILKLLARIKGVKTESQEKEFIQTVYFIFLFMQVFLVVSLASFFTVTLGEYFNNLRQLQTLQAVLNLLAKNLPKAANYFFSYMVLQALSTSSGTLLQVGRLVSWVIIAPLQDTTPRQKWARLYKVDDIKWGSFFPVYTNIACIGIIYCVIAPFISVCTILTFLLLWLAYGYSMIYVNNFEADTGGVLYPRAINQTFTGLYVMELCMSGMFFGVMDDKGNYACTVHGFLMICMLVLTAVYQILLNSSFSPLFRYLPVQAEEDSQRSASSCANREGGEAGEAEHVEETFMHSALGAVKSIVWIPQDPLGVSDHIKAILKNKPTVRISNRSASLDKETARVKLYGNPPVAQPGAL